MSEPTASHDTEVLSLDDIIDELDTEYSGELPERALRAAQRRREEITPRLIELIRKATEGARSGNVPERNGHFYALFLLAEFEAKEALPAILEAVSLPGELPMDLFGDAITEVLDRVLAALAADQPDVIDDLISDQSLNEYVRWEAAQAYLDFVRHGRLTREEAVRRLRDHLREAIDKLDTEGVNGLVAELVSYAPREALEEIKEAFRLGLVDEMIVNMESVDESIAGGESRFRKELEYRGPSGIPDTVEHFQRWYSFRDTQQPEPSASVDDDDWLERSAAERAVAPTTIRNEAPRVGRNDPCPCGSGRKYKKCCGAR